eukprot:scaffold68072_cov56-Phaeocystis_antarctica.AAC.1
MDMLILIRASCAPPPRRPNPPPSLVRVRIRVRVRVWVWVGPDLLSHALAPAGRRLHRQPGLHLLRQHCARARPQPWDGCRLEHPDHGVRKVPGGDSYRYMSEQSTPWSLRA